MSIYRYIDIRKSILYFHRRKKINIHRRNWEREGKAALFWRGVWCSRIVGWASLPFWNLTRSIPCPHSHQRLQTLERTHELEIQEAFVGTFIQCPGIAERYKLVPHCPLYWWESSSQSNRTKKQKRQHFPESKDTPAH